MFSDEPLIQFFNDELASIARSLTTNLNESFIVFKFTATIVAQDLAL